MSPTSEEQTHKGPSSSSEASPFQPRLSAPSIRAIVVNLREGDLDVKLSSYAKLGARYTQGVCLNFDRFGRICVRLGRVLREKESKKTDWKERVTKQIAGAGQTLKRHANKVSNKVRQWLRPEKAAAGSKKKATSTNAEL